MNLGLALLERTTGDVVLSPYGLARALDAVRRGARGAAREALDELLDAPPRVDGIVSAQAIWLAPGYSPGPALTGIDTGPLDPARINAWSNDRTHGMIPHIVDGFGPDEIFALTDAEYLDARWRTPFEDTRPAPFEGAGEVPMMVVHGRFEHGDGAIRLPYAAHDLRFVAMLGDWREVEFRHGQGTVELPRFSTTSRLDLTGPLRALGLGPAFAASDDFDELIQGPGVKAISQVLQRARVDVDEAGTRAAATTALVMRATSMPLAPFHLVFDRPFVWGVEHAPTGTQLFVGRVRNPQRRSD